MTIRFQNLRLKLSGTFWFVPSLMTFAAFLLSFAMIAVDEATDADFISELGWLYTNKPEGAREVLSTIAGSMITVAGVVFSITIVALSLASSQFGPRLLGNFMRDKGNQVVLGTFISTYFYCLLILRTIRSGDETQFVPHISVAVGVLLAICSLGVLIYFIHHVSESIQASSIIQKVNNDLEAIIKQMYPEKDKQKPRKKLNSDYKLSHAITASSNSVRSGYLQAADKDKLLSLAKKNNLVIEITARPGEYILAGQQVATVHSQISCPINILEEIADSFLFGIERSIEQDVLFPVNQLVEVALRALSTSINDPFTAISCLDKLTGGICFLLNRDVPDSFCADEKGQIRIVAPPVLFPEVIDSGFSQIRIFGKKNPKISMHLLHCFYQLSLRVNETENKQALLHQTKLTFEEGIQHIADPKQKEKFKDLYNKILSELSS